MAIGRKWRLLERQLFHRLLKWLWVRKPDVVLSLFVLFNANLLPRFGILIAAHPFLCRKRDDQSTAELLPAFLWRRSRGLWWLRKSIT